MTRIRFHALFAERIGGIDTVEVEAATVLGALRALTERHPELTRLVWLGEGTVNPVMAFFVNDRQVRGKELTAPLQPGDQVEVIPAISGG